jgi:hypothetical protein
LVVRLQKLGALLMAQPGSDSNSPFWRRRNACCLVGCLTNMKRRVRCDACASWVVRKTPSSVMTSHLGFRGRTKGSHEYLQSGKPWSGWNSNRALPNMSYGSVFS